MADRPSLAEIAVEQVDIPGVRLGLVRAAPVAMGPAGPALERELEELAGELGRRWAGRQPAAIPGLSPARQLYRAFGVDPTKTRPSSEALLRRVLRGEPLPRILNAVDLANLLAVRFMLPIGLYDADRIEGPVALRRGQPGESYPGIRKPVVHLEGRPVLADRRGPFGNPTADSRRTAVGPSTSDLWLVIFAPDTLDKERLASHVTEARDAIELHLAPPGATVRTRGSAGAPSDQ